MFDRKVLLDNTSKVRSQLDRTQYPETYAALSDIYISEDTLFEIASRLVECDKPKDLPPFVIEYITSLYEIEIAKGNHHAMNNLGAHYYGGDRGFEQNFRKAVELYNMAAENGNRQAQRNLGYCYYYGRDMDVDYEKAFHYFALGAFDGYLISLYKIGDMYLHGYYVKKNEKEAFLIYKRCLAEMTTEEHSFVAGPVHLRLGNMYLNGVGTEQDTEEALLHYSIAEIALFKMVKDGDYMYKKSLQSAIKGQEKARALLAKELPEQEWTFDDQRYSPENTSERTERDHVFVRADDHATRQRIIDDLESRGFTVDNRDRQEILESRFPLTVNMAKKTYSAMGNVTCAAAAVSSGHLMTVEEFYAKYLG